MLALFLRVMMSACVLLVSMNVPRVVGFALIVLVLAWLVGRRSKAQGLSFWRTFIMAIIGFASLGLLFVNIFGYLVE